MRLLWICAFAPSVIARTLGKAQNAYGGWIDGGLKAIATVPDVSLTVCFPQSESEKTIKGSAEGIDYYGIFNNKAQHSYNPMLIGSYKEVIEDCLPDVVHIWGVEFPYYYAVIEATNHRIPIASSIQGLCGIISKHYFADLPIEVVKAYSFRDFIKRDNIMRQRNKFAERGEFEEKILKDVDHVIGRTEWDKACTSILARNAEYHFCNEILRNVFYEKADSWTYETCEKHSIFVSQASYPIKGFHHVLEAFTILLEEYPDAMLYSTGDSPFSIPSYRIGSYQKYIKHLIVNNNLKAKVRFLGTLNAEEMCKRYLRSNVFVSASSIENSPNSVGEAMMLGMPVVASYVGGTMDLLTDKKEGFLYQSDAPYMLAHYINKVFNEELDAKERGHNAYIHAKETHDPWKNTQCLMKIYENITNGGSV